MSNTDGLELFCERLKRCLIRLFTETEIDEVLAFFRFMYRDDLCSNVWLEFWRVLGPDKNVMIIAGLGERNAIDRNSFDHSASCRNRVEMINRPRYTVGF